MAASTFGVPDGLIGPKPGKKDRKPHPSVDDDEASAARGGASAGGVTPRLGISLDEAVRLTAASREEFNPDVETPEGIAAQKLLIMRRQLTTAREVQAIGMRVLRAISLAVSSNDLLEAGDAVRRLLAANADKDSLNALLKAALGTVDGGMVMERRAMNLDEKQGTGAGNTPATPQVDAGAAVWERLSTSDPTLLLELRERVVAVTRAKPGKAAPKTIDGKIIHKGGQA
jgi:hypothetical protein